jgi:ABC-type multidrug transport system ATPase subunit
MTESMLAALMRLFAILANFSRDADILARNFVDSYLKAQFSRKTVDKALAVFDAEKRSIHSVEGMKVSKRISALSVKILKICTQINQELQIKNKFLILISLIKFLKYFEDNTMGEEESSRNLSDAIITISQYLQIQREEYENCRIFINDKFYKVPVKENLLVINNLDNFEFSGINHLQNKGLKGQLFFLRVRQAGIILFYYVGSESMEMGGQYIFPNHIYIFPRGASIRGEEVSPVYFSDVEAAYLRKEDFEQVEFVARDIEFCYPRSQNGIKKFSLSASSGEMVGIMGGSGVGKSTLLKVLNGILPLHSGSIYINGHRTDTPENEVEGMIGYVPQDDLLIEELTVYQNLYYRARLCLGNLTEEQLNQTVLKVLGELDLFYIKDLKVGTPLNKLISGGQRKRLNIALELIMEPYILFADEPTSGLSSTDSENVLQLLKFLTHKGKIVFLNIHQPSSELFKMFDKILVLDKGGHVAFYGNPMDSFSYIKEITHRVDASDFECSCCGNVQPDELLKIIEARQVNELGELTDERIISPEEWYNMYREKIVSRFQEEEPDTIEIPSLKFNLPNRIRQFVSYSRRNVLSKISDRQYMSLALLISPILALIVSMFSKFYSTGSDGQPVYIFAENLNLPAYLFMTVIVSLFIGLIVSGEDILRDRKTREREKFLNLSKVSYFNSKIVFLFALSAFQMFIYVIVGNHLLEIRGMTFNYWIILFSTSCFAVMLGLNISSAFKTAVAVYINVPFILVPLILLAGVIVKYDKLHYRMTSAEFVPIVGDLMASRWAYEALVVTQFKENRYQRHFYSIDEELANNSWELNFLIPELNNKISDYQKVSHDDPDLVHHMKVIKNSLNNFYPEEFSKGVFTTHAGKPEFDRIEAFLEQRRKFLISYAEMLVKRKDEILEKFRIQGLSNEDISDLRRDYHNESIADLVLNKDELVKIEEFRDRLIRKDSPVYQEPLSVAGRAQYYAGFKRLGKWKLDTLWFNVMVLWFITIFLYICLVQDYFGKFNHFLFNWKKRVQGWIH